MSMGTGMLQTDRIFMLESRHLIRQGSLDRLEEFLQLLVRQAGDPEEVEDLNEVFAKRMLGSEGHFTVKQLVPVKIALFVKAEKCYATKNELIRLLTK